LPILPDRGANRFRPTVVMFNTQGTSPAA
jgi:hypothetical protein